MNHRTDNEDLLNDVLCEATPAEFRDAILHDTLRRVGRQRRWKQARASLALLIVAGAIGFLAWSHFLHSTKAPLQVLAQKGCQLIRTEPLQSGVIVTTRSLNLEQLIVSAPVANLIQTRSGSEAFRIINDDELLALVARRPAVLVRLGQNSEQLIFVDPEDAKGFPIN